MGKRGRSVQSRNFDQEHVQKALLKQILIDEISFAIVDVVEFKVAMKAVFPEFQIPSTDTISRDCVEFFMKEKLKLKSFIKRTKQQISLSLDTWKSNKSVNYLCITAHFLDDTWKLHKKIISFTPILNDNGEEIVRMIEKCLNDWEINDVLTISTGNGCSYDAAITYLKGRLPNLMLDGKFLHLKCSVDITNSIVKDVLTKYEDSIARVRAGIKCVVKSASRVKMFQACIEEFEIMNACTMSVDCPNMWNTTFDMLKVAQKYESIFSWFENSPTYNRDLVGTCGGPVYEDWKKIRKVLSVLKGFHRSIENISKMHHLTSIKFLNEIADIDFYLDDIGKSSCGSYQSMMTSLDMKSKFNEYWGNVDSSNMLIYIANILDPYNKNWFLECYFMNKYKHDYTDEGVPTWKKKAEFVLSATYDLFNDYIVKTGATSQNANFQNSGYMEYLYNDKSSGGLGCMRVIGFGGNLNCKTELDIYLNEKSIDDDDYNGFDVLQWWKNNSARFPILSKMAKDVLAIPISSVDQKSAYNINGNVLKDFQSALSPSVLEALICTKDWVQKSLKQTKVKKILFDLDKLVDKFVTDVYKQVKNATK